MATTRRVFMLSAAALAAVTAGGLVTLSSRASAVERVLREMFRDRPIADGVIPEIARTFVENRPRYTRNAAFSVLLSGSGALEAVDAALEPHPLLHRAIWRMHSDIANYFFVMTNYLDVAEGVQDGPVIVTGAPDLGVSFCKARYAEFGFEDDGAEV